MHPGAYRGTKRQKEMKRLQKQEEKRLKRMNKKLGTPEDEEPGDVPPEISSDESEDQAPAQESPESP